MMNKKLLNDAIVESIECNRIVSVDYAGNIAACVADLYEYWDGDTDYARENDGSYDMWGWNDETPENEQNWRLSIHCSA
jgi:hypothetical protein